MKNYHYRLIITFDIVNNIDGGTLARLTMTMSGDQVASIINTLDVDMNNRESVVRLLVELRNIMYNN